MNNRIRSLIKTILISPLQHEWSLQGFGMLRLYLGDSQEDRLHVWSPQHRIENVSDIHDHPWDFESLVVSGMLQNQRFSEADIGGEYTRATILCGENAQIESAECAVRLQGGAIEEYRQGQSYRQTAEQIHQSCASEGCVTVVARAFRLDRNHARVYWPAGTGWINARPRRATDNEVLSICHSALENWS